MMESWNTTTNRSNRNKSSESTSHTPTTSSRMDETTPEGSSSVSRFVSREEERGSENGTAAAARALLSTQHLEMALEDKEMDRICAAMPMPLFPIFLPQNRDQESGENPRAMEPATTGDNDDIQKAAGGTKEKFSDEESDENEDSDEHNILSQLLTQEPIDWDTIELSFPDEEEESRPDVDGRPHATDGDPACSEATEQAPRLKDGSNLDAACIESRQGAIDVDNLDSANEGSSMPATGCSAAKKQVSSWKHDSKLEATSTTTRLPVVIDIDATDMTNDDAKLEAACSSTATKEAPGCKDNSKLGPASTATRPIVIDIDATNTANEDSKLGSTYSSTATKEASGCRDNSKLEAASTAIRPVVIDIEATTDTANEASSKLEAAPCSGTATKQAPRYNINYTVEATDITTGKRARNDNDDDGNPKPTKVIIGLPTSFCEANSVPDQEVPHIAKLGQPLIRSFFKSGIPNERKPQVATTNKNGEAKDDGSWEYCGRNYKKGDVWKCDASKIRWAGDQELLRSLAGFFFTIGERTKDNGIHSKVTIETTHVLLTDTFLGRKYGQMLAESRRRLGKSAPDRVKYVTQFLPNDRSLFLRLLTEREQRAPASVAPDSTYKETQHEMVVSDLLYEKSRRLEDDFGRERKRKSKEKALLSLKEEACAFFYEVQEIRKLDVSRRRRKKPTVLDIFSGAGGMSLGLVEAGFDVTYHVDYNRDCCCTLERNFKDCVVIPECVKVFLENCKIRKAKVYPAPGDFNHIHGSPPCQGFSDANKGGVNDSHNNSLTLVLVEAILYFQPDTFTIENVLGMERESRGRKEYLEHTIFLFLEAGYQVRTCVLKASDYGDPQIRQRIILFGAKTGFRLPAIPKATHGPGLQEKIQTCQDALGCLDDIAPAEDSGFVELPCGKLVRDHCTNGQPSATKSRYTVHIVASEPAKTLLRTNPIIHYATHRQQLTIRECALLQSFPIDYLFSGDHRSIRGQIGNAVPTRLAYAIGKAVMDSYVLESCATLQDDRR